MDDTRACEVEELRRTVFAEVQALREPYQSVILLRYYEGLSPKEIAKLQVVPVNTVHMRIRRALEQLAPRLRRRDDDLPFAALPLVALAVPASRVVEVTAGEGAGVMSLGLPGAVVRQARFSTGVVVGSIAAIGLFAIIAIPLVLGAGSPERRVASVAPPPVSNSGIADVGRRTVLGQAQGTRAPRNSPGSVPAIGRVELPPKDTTAFVVELRDRATGEFIVDATVTVNAVDRGFAYRTVTVSDRAEATKALGVAKADEQGAVRIRLGTTSHVELVASANGYWPRSTRVSMSDLDGDIPVRLELIRAPDFSVRIVDEKDQPVAGVAVRIQGTLTESDVDGYAHAVARQGPVVYELSHPGWASVRRLLSASDRTTVIRAVAGERRRGRVVDELGRGVSGATIESWRRGWTRPGEMTVSDPEGFFDSISASPDDRVMAWVRHHEFSTTRGQISADEGGEVVLSRGTRVVGTVAAALPAMATEPAAKGEVRVISRLRELSSSEFRWSWSPTGEIEIGLLPDGDFWLLLKHAELGSACVPLTLAGDGLIDLQSITLDTRMITVEASNLDGSPAAGVPIKLARDPGGPLWGFETVTNRDGHARCRLVSPFPEPPGQWVRRPSRSSGELIGLVSPAFQLVEKDDASSSKVRTRESINCFSLSDSATELPIQICGAAAPLPHLEFFDRQGQPLRGRFEWTVYPADASPSVPVRMRAKKDGNLSWPNNYHQLGRSLVAVRSRHHAVEWLLWSEIEPGTSVTLEPQRPRFIEVNSPLGIPVSDRGLFIVPIVNGVRSPVAVFFGCTDARGRIGANALSDGNYGFFLGDAPARFAEHGVAVATPSGSLLVVTLSSAEVTSITLEE